MNKLKSRKISFFIILLANLFAIFVGIMLKQDELLQDPWFIEASADGLFGLNNRGFLTLGSNFIITGIIYLLSLTSIRLMWFHIILLFALFMSNFLLCNLFDKYMKSFAKYIYIIIIMIITIDRLIACYNIQYSAIAAYTISVGIALISVDDNNKFNIKLGIIWCVFGICLRPETLYFSIPFFGCTWLLKIILNYRKKRPINILNSLRPYFIILFFFLVLLIAQKVFMFLENSDFYNWNSARATYDDYGLPDYSLYVSDYEKLGVSENDYYLLKSWNNYDPDFFNSEKMEGIKEIIDKEKNNTEVSQIFFKLLTDFKSNSEFLALIILILLSIVKYGHKIIPYIMCALTILTIYLFYFAYLNKGAGFEGSSIHIYGSLICVLISNISSIILQQKELPKSNNKIVNILLFSFIPMIMIVHFPNYDSIWNKYYNRLTSGDKYYSYIKSDEINHHTNTYNVEVSQYIETHKENYYYRLFVFDWFSQQYPLTDRDFFHTAPVNSASNWGSLGQYQLKLKVMQSNLKNYKINDPIKDLINDNVKIVIKANCSDRALLLNNYLREHYYNDVDLSIIEIVDNCLIGRYMTDIDITNLNNNNIKKQDTTISVSNYTYGMLYLKLSLNALPDSCDNVYIKLCNKESSFTYQCIINDESDSYKLLIPESSFDLTQEYSLYIITEINDTYLTSERINVSNILLPD